MSASRRWPFWHHRCHGSVKRKRKRATPCSCAFIDPGRAHTSTRSLHVCPGHWAPASMLTLKIPCRQLHRIPVSKPTGLENTSHLLPLRVPQSQTVGPPEEEDGLASPTRSSAVSSHMTPGQTCAAHACIGCTSPGLQHPVLPQEGAKHLLWHWVISQQEYRDSRIMLHYSGLGGPPHLQQISSLLSQRAIQEATREQTNAARIQHLRS